MLMGAVRIECQEKSVLHCIFNESTYGTHTRERIKMHRFHVRWSGRSRPFRPTWDSEPVNRFGPNSNFRGKEVTICSECRAAHLCRPASVRRSARRNALWKNVKCFGELFVAFESIELSTCSRDFGRSLQILSAGMHDDGTLIGQY